MYMLEPETLAEAIMKKFLAGEGGQVILPGFFGLFAPIIRALPWWMARPMQRRDGKKEERARGRRVEDPSKKYAKKAWILWGRYESWK
jgi:hypothetical protein